MTHEMVTYQAVNWALRRVLADEVDVLFHHVPAKLKAVDNALWKGHARKQGSRGSTQVRG